MKALEPRPIIINITSPSLVSRDSPRCQLRIPEVINPEMLSFPRPYLPNINRAHSHAPSPLPVSHRVAKNKDVEFPDIYSKERDINAKAIRKMKKHSSDKGIRYTNQEPDELPRMKPEIFK